jgi:hypothetical protein
MRNLVDRVVCLAGLGALACGDRGLVRWGRCCSTCFRQLNAVWRLQQPPSDRKYASSEEFVGKLRLGQFAK